MNKANVSDRQGNVKPNALLSPGGSHLSAMLWGQDEWREIIKRTLEAGTYIHCHWCAQSERKGDCNRTHTSHYEQILAWTWPGLNSRLQTGGRLLVESPKSRNHSIGPATANVLANLKSFLISPVKWLTQSRLRMQQVCGKNWPMKVFMIRKCQHAPPQVHRALSDQYPFLKDTSSPLLTLTHLSLLFPLTFQDLRTSGFSSWKPSLTHPLPDEGNIPLQPLRLWAF